MTGTPRLVLSRLARADVDELVVMLLDPGLYEYIGDVPGAAEAGERVERWLRGSGDPDVLWINYVARRRDGRFVGLAQGTVRGGACEIAYLVDPPAQRQGFGAEMMRAFRDELRETVNPAELVAHIHPGHAASEGVARALGLAPTLYTVDGERAWSSLRDPGSSAQGGRDRQAGQDRDDDQGG